MGNSFLSQNIWSQLTQAVQNSKSASHVAVAYFGAGSSRLLPLPPGSTLVVDASERAVSSGQTCPQDLLMLINAGVKVFSVPNLHAKVYVVGRSVYIGSANVSNHSAKHLLEAMLHTTDAQIVAAARKFVRDLCLHELTPELVKRLGKLYHPPIPTSNDKSEKALPKHQANRPSLPRLLLAQLKLVSWSEQEQNIHDKGLVVAKKRRKHPRTFETASFMHVGSCSYRVDDVVIQITDEGQGQIFVSPPGNVLHIESNPDSGKRISFVYLEHPVKKRKRFQTVVKKLGRGSATLLRKKGLVRDRKLAQAMLSLWSRSKAS